jgi:transposase-like protein
MSRDQARKPPADTHRDTQWPHRLAVPPPSAPRPAAGPHSLSRRLAAIMRPALPVLVDQVTSEIRASIPEYTRLADGPSGPAVRNRIERAAGLFVDLVDDPTTSRDRLNDTCRRLGAEEAAAGRPLDNLLTAYHVGARVGWRWIMRLGRSHDLSSPVMSRLAEMLFNYVDELSTLSCQGYHRAETRTRDSGAELRRRLLHLILDQPDVFRRPIADLARTVGWQVPEQVVLVAVEPGAGALAGRLLVPREPVRGEPVSGGPVLGGPVLGGPVPGGPVPGDDTLADLRDPEPHLLVPAPLDTCRAQRIAAYFGGAHVAIGPAMPLARAASSLRWARQALRMVDEGVLADTAVTFCADHLTTLWLLADEELLAQVGRRKLSALDRFPGKQRLRLAATLYAWLQTNGNVREIAAKLGVHPQTVRYRMRQLQDVLGDTLHDPDARFEMEATLRAAELRADARELLG